MKHLFLTLSSLLLISPALANESEAPKKGHDHAMSATTMQDHAQKMEHSIQASQTYAERALDIVVMGNALAAEATSKKDLKKALHALKMLKQGHTMHHKSMHALEQHQRSLKNHLVHAQFGEKKLEQATLTHLQQRYDALTQTIKEIHKNCHAEMKKAQEHSHNLAQLGNELMVKAKSSKNPEQMLLGAELMEQAIAFTLHHHTEGKKMSQRMRMPHSGPMHP